MDAMVSRAVHFRRPVCCLVDCRGIRRRGHRRSPDELRFIRLHHRDDFSDTRATLLFAGNRAGLAGSDCPASFGWAMNKP